MFLVEITLCMKSRQTETTLCVADFLKPYSHLVKVVYIYDWQKEMFPYQAKKKPIYTTTDTPTMKHYVYPLICQNNINLVTTSGMLLVNWPKPRKYRHY